MRALVTFMALLITGVLQPLSAAQAAQVPADDGDASSSASAVNPVIEWNKVLLSIVRTKGAQPATVHPTHSFAILHAAIYDAVNAIDRTHKPYAVELTRVPRGASRDAAASAAAHEVLSALYPAFQATLDAELSQLLAQVSDTTKADNGVTVGRAVADALLALRSKDGSGASPIPYVFGTGPGAYQSTPPNFPPQPQFTHWSRVTPFALQRADQFRPGPPPALTSDAYSDVFNQVKSLGVLNSTVATADQKQIGTFWNGAIQNYWNEIAQTAALRHSLNTAQTARLFALLNLTLADGVIAFYDAKYTYNFWRPVTAIRAADTDGNPETLADPNWLPENTTTAPDPSYPGAHAVISAGAAAVLVAFFGPEHLNLPVTSEVLPGIVRNFDSFLGAEQEASFSRVLAGQHFLTDQAAGEKLGLQVAALVVEDLLSPVRDQDAR
jgi:membrane-associated phospholipid phosphatase